MKDGLARYRETFIEGYVWGFLAGEDYDIENQATLLANEEWEDFYKAHSKGFGRAIG